MRPPPMDTAPAPENPSRGAALETDKNDPLCCQNFPCGNINNDHSTDPPPFNPMLLAHTMFRESDSPGKYQLIK